MSSRLELCPYGAQPWEELIAGAPGGGLTVLACLGITARPWGREEGESFVKRRLLAFNRAIWGGRGSGGQSRPVGATRWRWLLDNKSTGWTSLTPAVRGRLRRWWGPVGRARGPASVSSREAAVADDGGPKPTQTGPLADPLTSTPSKVTHSLRKAFKPRSWSCGTGMDSYFRSVYVSNRGRVDASSERGPWQTSFLRRNTTKEHLNQASAGTSAGPGQAAASAGTEAAGGAASSGSRCTPTASAGGVEMSAFARAFEKKRLAIVASLRHRTKLSLLLFCPLLVVVMIFATLVSFWHESSSSSSTAGDALSSVYPPAALFDGPNGKGAVRERFTVMINTYRRHDMARDAVQHYANCERVDSIRVVWSENSTAPQECCDREWFSSKKKVFYDKYDTTSLNNRFVPPEGLHTDAVFAVDDDIRVPCADLEFAHEVWKVADGSLVGFMPRIHSLVGPKLRGNSNTNSGASNGGESAVAATAQQQTSGPPLFRYNGWWKVWWDGEYSLVLTKAAFLHRDFLKSYTYEMPPSIRDYVDKNRNCEDIAMQFLASNMTGKAPIFVRGHLTDLGVFKGISTKSWTKLGHMKSRGQCLNDFVELYGGTMPLVKGRIVAGPASSWWFNQPSTVFEYFSSDLLAVHQTGLPSLRSSRLLHFVPVLLLCIVGVIKLVY